MVYKWIIALLFLVTPVFTAPEATINNIATPITLEAPISESTIDSPLTEDISSMTDPSTEIINNEVITDIESSQMNSESQIADQNTPITKTKPKVNPIVQISTTMGDIFVELFQTEAPETVANFLNYANDGYYEETLFHRVIEGFMVQGGGFKRGLILKKSKKPVKNEASITQKNLRGTLAMARTYEIDSATSQFFINLNDNPHLDHRNKTPQGYGYCVFGKVINGIDVVDKIGKAKTQRANYYNDVPVNEIMITKISVIR